MAINDSVTCNSKIRGGRKRTHGMVCPWWILNGPNTNAEQGWRRSLKWEVIRQGHATVTRASIKILFVNQNVVTKTCGEL